MLQVVVFGGLGLAALHVWRRRGGRAAALLAAAFGVLAAAVVAGMLLPQRSADPAVLWGRKLLVAAVVVFPWLLFAFASSFSSPVGWLRRAAGWLTGAAIAGALLVPALPEPGDPRSPVLQAYVAVVVVQWVVLSAAVARILWRSGRDQTTVVRRRMRTLSIGALALAAAVVTAGLAPPSREVTVDQLVVQLLAIGSGPAFLLGFATPRPLRMAWRRPEEAALREAEIHLLRAGGPTDVAHILLPAAARLVGGRAAVLVDAEGRLLGAHGVDAAEAESVAVRTPGHPEGVQAAAGAHQPLAVDLQSGTLIVEMTPFSPFFGSDEIELLRRVGALVDVALQRATADAEIRRLNDELGQRVRELEAANKELEAFSYSVSHDLRAPLRAIDGFSMILVEDHAEELSAQGRRHVETIRRSTQHMADLVDDLLALSRTGRQPLRKQLVEPAQLARQAVEELDGERADGLLQIRIEDLPPCEADPLLLKQVFVNLLSNALKFTRGTENALVEVGWRQEEPTARRIYFVRDNGAGFDMRYAHKLFGVFQRLHRSEDFEGTGVGLAIAQRIVQRHGGQIWAEGEVGHGACFEFCLQ